VEEQMLARALAASAQSFKEEYEGGITRVIDILENFLSDMMCGVSKKITAREVAEVYYNVANGPRPKQDSIFALHDFIDGRWHALDEETIFHLNTEMLNIAKCHSTT
tara:strand:- start:329 stop:649 length:321 start_codon:yes stop_codon:yes gene_type:complete